MGVGEGDIQGKGRGTDVAHEKDNRIKYVRLVIHEDRHDVIVLYEGGMQRGGRLGDRRRTAGIRVAEWRDTREPSRGPPSSLTTHG